MKIKTALASSYAYITELEEKIVADEKHAAEEKANREAEEAKSMVDEAKPDAKSEAEPPKKVVKSIVDAAFHAAILEAERKISLNELFELFKSTCLSIKATEESLQPFVDYLKKRWSRIKEFYSLHYTTRHNDPLTIACMKLATDLAAIKLFTKIRIELVREVADEKEEVKENEEKKFDKLIPIEITESAHRYDLLIPNIVTRNEIFGNEPDEDYSLDGQPLELHHFILDVPGYKHKLPTRPLTHTPKHDTYIVNVKTCMEYLSKNDRTLVHTSRLIGGKELLLSNTLANRVIYRSHETLNLWTNIELLKTTETYSESVGGALERLIQALRTGSRIGRGSERIASPEAAQGIVQFQKYLIYNLGVDSKNYKTLMELHAKEGYYFTFKSLWYVLLLGAAGMSAELQFNDHKIEEIRSHLNPKQGDIDGRGNPGFFCVNVIQGDIAYILKMHYNLLYGMSTDKQSKTKLINLNNEVVGNQAAINDGMRDNTLTPIETDEIAYFPEDVRTALRQNDLNTPKVRLLISDHIYLCKLLCLLDKDRRSVLCHIYLTSLFVVNTFANFKNLVSGLQAIQETCDQEQAAVLQWEIISIVGNEFLFKNINSAKKLLKIAEVLSPENFLRLIRDKLDVGECMANAKRDPENFLKALSAETRDAVKYLFPVSIVRKTASLISSATSSFFSKRKASESVEENDNKDKRQHHDSGSLSSSASDADEFAATQVLPMTDEDETIRMSGPQR